MTEFNEFLALLVSILAWGMLCAFMFWVVAVSQCCWAAGFERSSCHFCGGGDRRAINRLVTPAVAA